MLSGLTCQLDFSHFPIVVSWLISVFYKNNAMATGLMSFHSWYLDCMNLSGLLHYQIGRIILLLK